MLGGLLAELRWICLVVLVVHHRVGQRLLALRAETILVSQFAIKLTQETLVVDAHSFHEVHL